MSGRSTWQPVTIETEGTLQGAAASDAHDGAFGETSLLGLQCFKSFVALECRRDGAAELLLWNGDVSPSAVSSAWRRLGGYELERWTHELPSNADEAARSARVAASTLGLQSAGQWSLQLSAPDEQHYGSDAPRLEISTPIDPPRVFECSLRLRSHDPGTTSDADAAGFDSRSAGFHSQDLTLHLLHQTPLPRGFDRSKFACGRLWAVAPDGVRVPISVLAKIPAAAKGAAPETRAALLFGYGAYGTCTDPGWDAERLALASTGIVAAIAHVRGGGEMGRGWHAAARRETKAVSFSDLEACATALCDAGLAARGGVALEGRSAGGLLVGACLNLNPSAYCAVLASVPFLDAAGKLQDASLPLTANEWEEFGNPNERTGHLSVLGFSPVHNVVPGEVYPPCLLLPAFNDARTGFSEALKFAHYIRTNGAPIEAQQAFVRTDMGGGHFRPANPDARRADRALEYGFVLHHCRRALKRSSPQATSQEPAPPAPPAPPAAGTMPSDVARTRQAPWPPPRTGSEGNVGGGGGLGTAHTLIYRAVQASDVEAVGRLRTLIFSPHLVTIGSQYLQSRLYADALAQKAAVIVAVDADGTLWGAADLASLPCEGGGVCGYITNVCVAPAARRRGIGGRLVDELEIVAARSDMRAAVLHVDIDNVAARELYITKGYTPGCDDRELAAAAALVPSAGTESPEQLLMTKLFRVEGKVPLSR